MILEAVFAGVLSMVTSSAAQARPVCDLVTEKDAAAVIGQVKQKRSTLGPDQCAFTAEGLSLMITRSSGQEPEQVEMLLALPKNRARAGDVVKDEPGIGQKAVSETSKGRLAIIAAAGDTVWSFGVDHVYSKDLSDVLPKLRELAKATIAGSR